MSVAKLKLELLCCQGGGRKVQIASKVIQSGIKRLFPARVSGMWMK